MAAGGGDPTLARVLALLHERHGVGTRTERCPGWMQARLARALEDLARRRGRPEGDVVAALATDGALLDEVAEALRVGETSLFRDGPQWAALRSEVLPRMAARRRVRALSVGCSTGEEAWTLAMCLDAALPGAVARSVLGIDRSRAAIETAAVGVYPASVGGSVPADLARRYLERDGDSIRVGGGLREIARFARRDVMAGLPPGRYEIVFCKNVLIYFGDEAGRRVAGRLVGALADGGLLFVARSEVARLRDLGCRAVEVAPGVTAFAG